VDSKQTFYYTYVLKSLKDGKLYIGWTNDIKSRLAKHNAGKVTATKSRLPFIIVYFEGCLSRKKAIEREKTLKTGFGRKYLKLRI
jgi:putative endonuclease